MSSNESSKEPLSDQPVDGGRDASANDAQSTAVTSEEPAGETSVDVPAARSEEAATESAAPPAEPEPRHMAEAERKIERTRASGMWIGAIVAAIVMILLLVFILQNLESVDIQLFAFHFSLPLGVALLLAALSAILIVAIPGAIRIMQLRRKLR